MSTKQLIIGTFEECFKKYLYDELVVGQLAHTKFKDGINKGDEVDVIMPGMVTLSDFDGEGDLKDPEKVTTSVAKVRIDKGKSFHFFLKEIEEKAIENAPDMGQKVKLAKAYAEDAIKQFAAGVDAAYAGLYTRAGLKITGNTPKAPLTLTAANVKTLLSYMQTLFQRGDGKGHHSWVDGQMIAIVPPEFQFYLGQIEDMKYTEMRQKQVTKGFIGELCGWDIVVSNNIAKSEEGVYQPLFGIKGKTLAGGVSSNLNTKSYNPEKNFNTAYKGYGLYGVGAPRADLLGTVAIKADLKIS